MEPPPLVPSTGARRPPPPARLGPVAHACPVPVGGCMGRRVLTGLPGCASARRQHTPRGRWHRPSRHVRATKAPGEQSGQHVRNTRAPPPEPCPRRARGTRPALTFARTAGSPGAPGHSAPTQAVSAFFRAWLGVFQRRHPHDEMHTPSCTGRPTNGGGGQWCRPLLLCLCPFSPFSLPGVSCVRLSLFLLSHPFFLSLARSLSRASLPQTPARFLAPTGAPGACSTPAGVVWPSGVG